MSTSISVSASSTVPARFIRPNPPNATRTIEALRELGYDSYSSVMDLLDNCVDAQAANIEITISEEKGDFRIVIEDDGLGMDEDTLDEALRLGSDTQRETGDLGKFGLGLVTASIGLSRRVEVYTRELDGNLIYGGFDLDDIAEHDQFRKWIQTDVLEINDLPLRGTRIQLSKTDRISNKNVTTFASTLRKKIGQVFRKFLKADRKITVNGKAVEPIDPLMLSDPNTSLVLETEIEVEGGGSVVLRAVELPDLGQAGNAERGIIAQNSGFYLLRNNREIIDAYTFDFYKKHPDFSHFRAEILFDGSLDSVFHTDVKKMSIHPSQSFLDRLRQATQGLITQAGREGRARAHVTRRKIDHSLAESNITRRATLIPKPKTLVEQRPGRAKRGTPARGASQRGKGATHVTDLRTISGMKVVFEEGDYGEGPFYQVGRQEGRTIRVVYNTQHPFWRELVELAAEPKVVAMLDYLVFAMANAELLVPEPALIFKQQVNATLVGLLV
ncbi:MAG TPA: ATP-binding protein [Pyrinomonadaceae bacterium]|nr:ATP-binding protein [Pyrinomonadaceae bacterium]